MKRILITNDDGIYSPGIREAYKAVRDLGEILLIAPASQKSGVGRSISIFEPIRVSEVLVDGIRGYAVGGTPTDAVIIGIFAKMPSKPDLVISGFNIGENLSTESVTTSGTIGAALEAATHGIPSVAISVEVREEAEKFDEIPKTGDLRIGKKFLRILAKKILQDGLPEGVDLLNVNIPYDADDSTEVRITRLARKVFNTSVEERRDPRGRAYYWINGGPIKENSPGTDVHALYQERCISVTPISLDTTSKIDFRILEEWLRR
ncbi:MAG: 5'/3'-nucleotidase SurE [Archaeoglobi archaeon]|nr:5'/3'-nucleotidase SurE [Candidatus Mnemosynella sp.]